MLRNKMRTRVVADLVDGLMDELSDNNPKGSLENDSPRLTVESFANHVYFYSDVDDDRCLALIKTIRDLDDFYRTQRATQMLPSTYPLTPIWLHINSRGGDLFAGLSIADQLSMIKSPIYTVVEGICASAATFISLSGTRRFILPSSFMMIHQPSTGFSGTFAEFKDESRFQEMAFELLMNLYTSKTKMKSEEVEKMLQGNSWFSASQALENGLVDSILIGDSYGE